VINNFDRNLSVIANFLRTLTRLGLKKESPPGGAGKNFKIKMTKNTEKEIL